MSRDIVCIDVSGHRGHLGVSGLRGRWLLLGSVPAAASLGLVVFGDDDILGVGDGDGCGVPGDGDALAGAFVSDVELVGQDWLSIPWECVDGSVMRRT